MELPVIGQLKKAKYYKLRLEMMQFITCNKIQTTIFN